MPLSLLLWCHLSSSWQVLWPYLLEFLTPIQFTNALTPLCKSLMCLAMKKQEEGEGSSLIRYDLNGQCWEAPGAGAALARPSAAGLLLWRYSSDLFFPTSAANLPSPYALTTRLLVSGWRRSSFVC